MNTPVNKILILFAHPRFEKSRVNRALLHGVDQIPQVTLHDLYERYPDFNVEVEQEQELMTAHQIIIWQHPFYMYGAPPLLKQWIDLVLEHGWAHGRGGDALKGKIIFNALTSGGSREAYTVSGYNRFTLREFVIPFEQASTLCKMIYLPPFAVQGTYLLTEEQLARHASLYHSLLRRLSRGDYNLESLKQLSLLNDWFDRDSEASES